MSNPCSGKIHCLEIISTTLMVIRNGDEVDDKSWKSEPRKLTSGRTKHKTENRYDTNTGINLHEIQINEHVQSQIKKLDEMKIRTLLAFIHV